MKRQSQAYIKRYKDKKTRTTVKKFNYIEKQTKHERKGQREKGEKAREIETDRQIKIEIEGLPRERERYRERET